MEFIALAGTFARRSVGWSLPCRDCRLNCDKDDIVHLCRVVARLRTHMLNDISAVLYKNVKWRWHAGELQLIPSLWRSYDGKSLSWRLCAVACVCWFVYDHILHGRVRKEGRLWVDQTSPFPSDLRPVVWDAQDVQDLEDRPPVRLRARHFQIRDLGVTGVYHAALSAAREERGPRPGGVADL